MWGKLCAPRKFPAKEKPNITSIKKLLQGVWSVRDRLVLLTWSEPVSTTNSRTCSQWERQTQQTELYRTKIARQSERAYSTKQRKLRLSLKKLRFWMLYALLSGSDCYILIVPADKNRALLLSKNGRPLQTKSIVQRIPIYETLLRWRHNGKHFNEDVCL